MIDSVISKLADDNGPLTKKQRELLNMEWQADIYDSAKGHWTIYGYGPSVGKTGNAEDCPIIFQGYVDPKMVPMIVALPKLYRAAFSAVRSTSVGSEAVADALAEAVDGIDDPPQPTYGAPLDGKWLEVE